MKKGLENQGNSHINTAKNWTNYWEIKKKVSDPLYLKFTVPVPPIPPQYKTCSALKQALLTLVVKEKMCFER